MKQRRTSAFSVGSRPLGSRCARALGLACALNVYAGAATAIEVTAMALLKDRAILKIDGHQRTLKVGAVSPEGVRLLEADASHARVEIDGVARDLKLDAHITSDFGAAPTAPVVRIVPGPGGHYFVDGQINGNPVNFLVDTGATDVVMNANFARSIGLNFVADGKPGAAETASGIVTAYHLVLNEVKVQALRLSRIDAVVIDGDFPSTPLLGQSFLNRLDIHRAGAVLELHAR